MTQTNSPPSETLEAPLSLEIPAFIQRSAKFDIQRSEDDEAPRKLSAVVTTETKIERYDLRGNLYYELLDHSAGAIERAGSRVPIFIDHSPSRGMVGKLLEFHIGDRETSMVAQLARTQRGREAATMIEDGMIDSVSVGARVLDYKLERSKNPDEPPTLRVTRWRVEEVSLMETVQPADANARVMALRDKGSPITIAIDKEIENMSKTDSPLEVVQDNAAEIERSRVSDILELGSTYSDEKEAHTAIKRGASVDEYRKGLLDRVAKRAPEAPKAERHEEIDSRDLKGYSVHRALRMLNGEQRGNCLEREVADEIARKAGRQSEGLWVPFEALASIQRAGEVTTVTDGTLVGTDTRADLYAESLRNNSVVAAAGARILTGLVGNVSLAVATGPSVSWTDEVSAPSVATYSTSAKGLSPKHMKAYLPFSRTLAIQSTPSIEALLRQELASAVAEELDRVSLFGGGSGEPDGIIESGAALVVVASGTPGLHNTFVAMESAVNAPNIPNRSRAYLVPSDVVGKTKTISKDTGSGQFVYEQGGTINGTRVFVSNALKGSPSKAIYGEFSELFVGFFGPGVELDLSPMDNAGIRNIRVFCDVDVLVRRANAFSYTQMYTP